MAIGNDGAAIRNSDSPAKYRTSRALPIGNI
jgi:hypothetical protein